MTTTTSQWHTNIAIHGEPYPTRYYAPAIQGDSADVLALSATYVDYLRAIHEAGHAVAALAGRGHLHSAQITKGVVASPTGAGVTYCCGLADGNAYAVFSAAGERAADRWLREVCLWTPERAVACEVGAYGDRRSFLSINPHVGFGDRKVDYLVVHDLADQAIDEHWQAIQAVAGALAWHQYLTGDAIAALADIPNGIHTTAA